LAVLHVNKRGSDFRS